MPEVFRHMHNYYKGHTYTDIGNNLLNTYERFFLPYEMEHPEDLRPADAMKISSPEVGGRCKHYPGCGLKAHAFQHFKPTNGRETVAFQLELVFF